MQRALCLPFLQWYQICWNRRGWGVVRLNNTTASGANFHPTPKLIIFYYHRSVLPRPSPLSGRTPSACINAAYSSGLSSFIIILLILAFQLMFASRRSASLLMGKNWPYCTCYRPINIIVIMLVTRGMSH